MAATEDLVPRRRFDTADFAPAEQFDRLRESVSGLYELEPPGLAEEEGFSAHTMSWHLGDVIVCTGFYAGRQRVTRTALAIRRGQIDHYKVQYRLVGGRQIDSDGERITVSPGDVVVEDMARPSTYVAEAGRSIVLYVARESLDDLVSRPGRVNGTVVGRPAAALLADHLQSVARNLPELPAEQARTIAAATLSLIAACVDPFLRVDDRARAAIDVTITRQICRYVECHLAERDLCAETLCATFHISRSTLYRLFAALGGVQSFVRERRLERAHALLSTIEGRVHLASLAQQHGFANGSVFSTAFRARFGYSPSEARAARRSPAVARPEPPSNGNEFGRWIRSIRA